MKKIIYTLLLIISAGTLNAQIGGIKKPKVKVPKVKKEDKAIGGKTISADAIIDKDEPPANDPNDPAYNAYRIVKMEVMKIGSSIETGGWQGKEITTPYLGEKFKKIQSNIDTLKANPKEADKTYLANFQTKKDSLFDIYTLQLAQSVAYTKYSQYFESLKNCIKMDQKSDYCAEKMVYKTYAKNLEEYRAANLGESSWIEGNIVISESYYNEEVPNKIIPNRVARVNQKSATLFGKEKWQGAPNFYIRELDKQINSLMSIRGLTAVKVESVEELITKLAGEKKTIETYISSGEFEAYKAEKAAEIIEARRLGKIGSTDREVIDFIKSNFDTETYGNIVKVVVLSRQWVVGVTEWGYPEEKHMIFELAVKKEDGKCYKVSGGVYRNYQGAGEYGGKYLDIFYVDGEMNCANINK